MLAHGQDLPLLLIILYQEILPEHQEQHLLYIRRWVIIKHIHLLMSQEHILRHNIMQEKLDDTNFLLYAAKHYTNTECYDTLEFYDDLKRFKYLKRLFNIYTENADLKERLILNHIIILYNIFGVEPTTRMLFFKLYEHKESLKPFLVFLNYMPEKICNIGLEGITINNIDIFADPIIEERLRKI